MQRLIPFGNTYAASEPFTIDEQSTVTLLIVRQDKTTSVGESEAEVQMRAADGENWTTIGQINDVSPAYQLHGTDEEIFYRVVRRQQSAWIAIDRTQDGLLSRTLQGATLSGAWDAGECIAAKFVAAVDPLTATTTGFLFSKTPDANAFGELLNPQPAGNWDDFGLRMDTTLGTAELIYDPPVATPGLSGHNASTIRIHDATGAVLTSFEATASGTDISIAPASGVPVALTPGETYYVTICHPDQEFSFSAGTLTGSGRFSLDQNDLPARFSANILNAGETVTLFAVEGEDSTIVLPVTYLNGDPVQLTADYMVHRIEEPGLYEWQRSDNSDAGVYLNTGWRN